MKVSGLDRLVAPVAPTQKPAARSQLTARQVQAQVPSVFTSDVDYARYLQGQTAVPGAEQSLGTFRVDPGGQDITSLSSGNAATFGPDLTLQRFDPTKYATPERAALGLKSIVAANQRALERARQNPDIDASDLNRAEMFLTIQFRKLQAVDPAAVPAGATAPTTDAASPTDSSTEEPSPLEFVFQQLATPAQLKAYNQMTADQKVQAEQAVIVAATPDAVFRAAATPDQLEAYEQMSEDQQALIAGVAKAQLLGTAEGSVSEGMDRAAQSLATPGQLALYQQLPEELKAVAARVIVEGSTPDAVFRALATPAQLNGYAQLSGDEQVEMAAAAVQSLLGETDSTTTDGATLEAHPLQPPECE